MSRKISIPIIFIGFFLGLVSFLSPGFLFCGFLAFFLFKTISKNVLPKDRRYILTIIIVALVLRLIALFAVQFYCSKKAVWDIGDAQDNITRGFTIADYVTGRSDERIYFGYYNTQGYTFFNGFFFGLFGKDIIGLKCLNILLVLVLGWLVYDLTKRMYSDLSAKIAMSIVLFWPTLFIWTITALKETHIIIALITMLWCIDIVASQKSFKKCCLFLGLAAIFALYVATIRIHLIMLLCLFFILISIYFIFRWIIGKGQTKSVRFFFLIILLFFILFLTREKIFHIARFVYGQALYINAGFLATGGFNYNLLGDIDSNYPSLINNPYYYTPKFIFVFLLRAFFHFLLEPLPWHLFSVTMLAFFPLMLLWYLMLFAAFVGIFKIYKAGNISKIIPLLIFIFIYITVCGVCVVNIGTAVRWRDVLVPIIAILASCGIVSRNTQ